MARYTGPVWKVSRRLGFSILESGKELNKRAYAPGQHGQRRRKMTEYGLQLAEKQKVRNYTFPKMCLFHQLLQREVFICDISIIFNRRHYAGMIS